MKIDRNGPPSQPPSAPNSDTQNPAAGDTAAASATAVLTFQPAAPLRPLAPRPPASPVSPDLFKAQGQNPYRDTAKPPQPAGAPLSEADKLRANAMTSGWTGTLAGQAAPKKPAPSVSNPPAAGPVPPKPVAANGTSITATSTPGSKPPASPAGSAGTGASKNASVSAMSTAAPPAKGEALTDAAQITRQPSPEQIEEILNVMTSQPVDHDLAIELTLTHYGIDIPNVALDENGDPMIRHAKDLQVADGGRWVGEMAQGEMRVADRSIYLADAAFESHNPAFLAATLVHEITHTNQIAKHGPAPAPAPDGTISQRDAAYELMSYQAMLRAGDQHPPRLTPDERSAIVDEVNHYRSQLTQENQAIYDRGEYYNVKEK